MAEVTVDSGDGEQKPAITREQYDAGRAVLDSLPSGVYSKCESCRQWKRGGKLTFRDGKVYCEPCAGVLPEPTGTVFENAVQQLARQAMEAQAKKAMTAVRKGWSGVPPEGTAARAAYDAGTISGRFSAGTHDAPAVIDVPVTSSTGLKWCPECGLGGLPSCSTCSGMKTEAEWKEWRDG